MAYSPINTVPVVEGRGDVQLEFPVAGEGDLDDGGAGGMVDGTAVVEILDVVPQLLPLPLADEGHGAVVGHVVVPDGGGGHEGQKRGESQHGLGSGENTF